MASSIDPAPPLIALAGPTAAGKTAFSLALVEALDGIGQPAEIVSVDSAQVYRGMDIGTAKPDAAIRAQVPHHLLDLLDPAETYSAARFAEDAAAAIASIRARGALPLLVGGTMLYFRALLEGLSALPPADAGVRAAMEAEAADLGWPALHARLAQVDPARAAQLHPNDAQRISRALEIALLSGRRASEHAPPSRGAYQGPVLRLAIRPPERARYLQGMEARLHAMMGAGFLAEVARLRDRGDLDLDLPSMRAVGYRQLWRHLEGDYSLDEAVHLAVTATRQYAKRQMTWLRGEGEKWRWIDPAEPNAAASVFMTFHESPVSA